MKISIVTPSFNSARFIRETILSVISQKGDFFIEYIIVDNCSSDGTKDIVNEFQSLLMGNNAVLKGSFIDLIFMSEPDEGMYDAINKGFKKSTGDIHAWINADDIYLPGAFSTIVKVFGKYPDVYWLKGVTSYITDETTIWKTGRCLLYSQSLIKSGIYGRDHFFIQQDSVFWRAELWVQSGEININYKLAGDYYLWLKFSELAPLITVKAWVSCFRKVQGQLSSDITAYQEEVKKISPRNSVSRKMKYFYKFEKILPIFFKKILFEFIFSQPKFSLILIDSCGVIRRATGKYYDVSRLITKNH